MTAYREVPPDQPPPAAPGRWPWWRRALHAFGVHHGEPRCERCGEMTQEERERLARLAIHQARQAGASGTDEAVVAWLRMLADRHHRQRNK